MKKVVLLVAFPIFLFIFVCGCDAPSVKPYEEVKDGIDFKALYEQYNSTNYHLEIASENLVKYLTVDNVDEVLGGTSVIYFGYPTCDGCRMLVDLLLEYSSDYNFPIYYVDLANERSIYQVANDALVKVQSGSDLYVKLLKYFDSYLEPLKITQDDKEYEAPEKTIASPSLAIVKDGEVETFLDSFACQETEVCSSGEADFRKSVMEAFQNYLTI